MSAQNIPKNIPKRIQLSRRKGWRMPPGTIGVARPGRWGNPFHVDDFGQHEAVRLFRAIAEGEWNPDDIVRFNDRIARQLYDLRNAWLKRIGRSPVEAMQSELRGHDLACWCAPGMDCHADVLLEIANR